ncbi:hypothetical protein [Streptomyces celluloflavus]|uniref:hypothetical protein n=1 Tax=Streptomyces celluloflavus TaxID=58344 RepID=UPI00368F62E4
MTTATAPLSPAAGRVFWQEPPFPSRPASAPQAPVADYALTGSYGLIFFTRTITSPAAES